MVICHFSLLFHGLSTSMVNVLEMEQAQEVERIVDCAEKDSTNFSRHFYIS